MEKYVRFQIFDQPVAGQCLSFWVTDAVSNKPEEH